MLKISKQRRALRWFFAIALGFLANSSVYARGNDNAVERARAALPGAERLNVDGRGIPNFVQGRLGQLDLGRPEFSAVQFMQDIAPALQGTGTEAFQARQVQTDNANGMHVRVQQYIGNLPVVGADMIVHADAQSGEVTGFTGYFAPAPKADLVASVPSRQAMRNALTQARITSATNLDRPSQTYILDDRGSVRLAWVMTVQYENAEGPQIDKVFADATTGELITRHPQIHHTKSWKTYQASGAQKTTIPGTLLVTNTGTTADQVAQTAHNHAGYVWDYYWNTHGRDSFDGAGATITSTVHYSTNYVNAYWDGTQMVYGDGDGVDAGPLGNALDVVGHEITHAVTERTAGLVYQNESGALNEAMSDIFGNSIEVAYRDGGTVNFKTWLVGEDCWTPATANDALRYMNNPTQDGSSKDYYPTRYTGTSDNGGVHWNSGIANLAYYLLVAGGQHPRGVTPSVTVSGIGVTKAEKIFYNALSTRMTSSSKFADARNATIAAAEALYGAGSNEAVQTANAWSAVGVVETATASYTLATLTNQGAATGASLTGTQTTPANATIMEFIASGGTGDADLYVKFGSAPTDTVYDCRPYASGNAETCSFSPSQAGTYYWRLKAYSTFSGLTLTIKSDKPAGASPTNTPTPVPAATNTPTRTNTPVPAATNTPTRTNTPAPAATNTPVPAATNTPVPAATNTPVPGGTERITNGGFEGSTSPWTKSGTGAYITTNGSYPQAGKGYAYLGSVNSATAAKVYQQITIPSGTAPSLTFWLAVVSAETTTSTQYDKLYIEVTNTSGTVLGTLGTFSNLNKTASSGTATYSQKSYSLAAYAGQTVRVQFRGTTDSSLTTTFRVDGVSVK